MSAYYSNSFQFLINLLKIAEPVFSLEDGGGRGKILKLKRYKLMTIKEQMIVT